MRTKKILKAMARLLSLMAVMSVGVTAQAEAVTMKELPSRHEMPTPAP